MPAYSTGTVKVLAGDMNRWVLLGGVTTGGTIVPGDLVQFVGESYYWYTVAKIIDAQTFETIENYVGAKVFDTYFAYMVTPLPTGTTGQVMSVDPAETTGLKFVAPGGVGSGIPATIVDVKGDLIAATAADAVARLAVGTTGQVLSADPAQATGLAWITPSAGGGIPVTIVDAKGDIIAATAADTVARLPVGSNGQVLAASSAAATGLVWSSAPSGILATLLDAKGDLIAASANDTAARLAVGTDGQLLSADSTQTTGLRWVAAGAGSGTVTSVAIASGGQEFSVMGSPITTAGTITLQKLAVNAIGDITGAIAYDWNNGAMFSARLTGNVTLTLSNPQSGGVYRMLLVQDGTGSRTLTIVPTPLWPGAGTAVTINATLNQRTQVELWYDGTSYHACMNKTGSI